MADEADIADIFQFRVLEQSIAAVRTARPGVVANGRCHYCDEDVGPAQKFCDEHCRDDWERIQGARQRAGASFSEVAALAL